MLPVRPREAFGDPLGLREIALRQLAHSGRQEADGADDNPWRREWREAAGHQHGARLKELARDARAKEQPPAVVAQFGLILQLAGLPEEAVTMGLERSPLESERHLFMAPRSLNEPVSWWLSSLR